MLYTYLVMQGRIKEPVNILKLNYVGMFFAIMRCILCFALMLVCFYVQFYAGVIALIELFIIHISLTVKYYLTIKEKFKN